MDEKFDEPIYLLTTSMNYYVIEDKRHDNQNQIEEGEIEAVYKSVNNTDIFRSLCLPDLSPRVIDTKIVVINSCFYMLAGCHFSFDHKGRYIYHPAHCLVRFCDLLHLSKSWQIGPSFTTPQRFIQVATSNNGSIVAIGYNSRGKQCALWLESLTSSWEELPQPPKSLNVIFMSPQILALTATHIFLMVLSTIEPYTYGLRFSVVEKKWEVFDKRSFNGSYSQGVVLYDSYLVVYGSFAPDVHWEKGSLRVYDLKNCSWMAVDHVVTATGIYKKVFPPHSTYIKDLPILFQVAQNKFALVWQDLYDYTTSPHRKPVEVYCSKFILHKTSESHPRPTRVKRKTTRTLTHAKPETKTTVTKQLSFYFEFVSHGIYPIDGVINSLSVRVTLADEGRTRKEQMSQMSYHGTQTLFGDFSFFGFL